MTTELGFLSKLLASLIRNYFPKRTSGAPLHTLSKLFDVPVCFVAPQSSFEAVYLFICGRRREAVARYRIICLVIGNTSCLFASQAFPGYPYAYQVH